MGTQGIQVTTAFDIHGFRIVRNLGIVRGITVRTRGVGGGKPLLDIHKIVARDRWTGKAVRAALIGVIGGGVAGILIGGVLGAMFPGQDGLGTVLMFGWAGAWIGAISGGILGFVLGV